MGISVAPSRPPVPFHLYPSYKLYISLSHFYLVFISSLCPSTHLPPHASISLSLARLCVTSTSLFQLPPSHHNQPEEEP